MLCPTDILKQEHRAIAALLGRLEGAAAHGLTTRCLDLALSGRLMELLSVLLHRWHRNKEERLLLPLIKERGVHERVIRAALAAEEHDSGYEEHLAVETAWRAVASGVPEAQWIFSRRVLGYSARLREHMRREEAIVFPLGEASLHPADRVSLVAAFSAVESQDPAPGTWDDIQRLVGKNCLDSVMPGSTRSDLGLEDAVRGGKRLDWVVGRGGAEVEQAAWIASPGACSAGARMG